MARDNLSFVYPSCFATYDSMIATRDCLERNGSRFFTPLASWQKARHDGVSSWNRIGYTKICAGDLIGQGLLSFNPSSSLPVFYCTVTQIP